MMRELLGRSGAVWMSMTHVDEQVFRAAADLFEHGGAAMGLSFTDCTSIIMMRRMGIGAIASFDGGFDSLVPRLC
jgi:predicted nucleic acid-binding protein